MPIKKKWFDKIKSGKKDRDFRDSHITFVCEETGETLRAEIEKVGIMPRSKVRKLLRSPPDFDEMFGDSRQVMFKLKRRGA